MSSTLALRRGKEEYRLCWPLPDRPAAAGPPSALNLHDEMSALLFLRSCMTNPAQEQDLRLWLQRCTYPSGMPVIPTADVLGQAAALIASGQLVVGPAETGAEGEMEGILRKGEGGGGTAGRRTRTPEHTPLQEEMARRQERVAEEEVIVLGEPKPEKNMDRNRVDRQERTTRPQRTIQTDASRWIGKMGPAGW